ncbi:MAG: hypothetical protein PHD95_00995 [Candidatus ainarchaeum sp.]|nr:hypothetical protein [Candidatus ainarchaeum sp.]
MKKKFKATILAIDHAHGPPLARFSKYLSPERTLYIEYPETDLEKDLKLPVPVMLHKITSDGPLSYTALAKRARQRGMRVVALDNAALFNIYLTLRDPLKAMKANFLPTDKAHVVTSLRERKWALKLRNTETGDIVVMHPLHAFRIARLLGVSRLKIKWFDYPNIHQLLHYWRATSPKRIQALKNARKVARKKNRTHR